MGLQTVDRACELLLALRRTSEASLGELSEACGLKKTTAFGVLASLVEHGLVFQDPRTKRYRLGVALLELAQGVFGADALRLAARPHLRELRDLTMESVGLSVRAGDQRVIVEAVDSELPVRQVLSVGRQIPLHLGMTGLVLLAELDDAELDRYVRRTGLLDAGAEQPIDEPTLRAKLDDVRRDGYAISEGQATPDAAGLAAPVRGPSGTVLAAVHIGAPASRWGGGRLVKFVPAILDSCAKIGASLAD